MRRRIGKDKWYRLSRGNREFADGRQVLTDEMNRSAQHDHVGTGDSPQHAVLEPSDPGNDCTVAEPQHELGAHGHLAPLANHETNHARTRSGQRHEIDQRDCAVAAFEASFQNQRIRPITTAHNGPAVPRRNLPVSVAIGAEQRREAGVGIEARPAQPIERAIARHQSGGLAIADQSVIFDTRRHEELCPEIDDHFDVALAML